jgi:prefoldin alpha subunit
MENNQEIVFRLSMLEQQLQQLQQQLQAVDRGITELESLNLGLDEIKGAKDKEIFAQVGRGIYVKAKIISEDLTVNIGENNFVNRNVSETKELIIEQIKKLKDVESELDKNIETTNNEFMVIVQEYQKQEKENPDDSYNLGDEKIEE